MAEGPRQARWAAVSVFGPRSKLSVRPVRLSPRSLPCGERHGVRSLRPEGWVVPVWAHSRNVAGLRHPLADHLRSTSALARQFAAPFGAGELAAAAGLLHDAGKASCAWQEKLLAVEGTDRPVGCDHKTLGAKLLVGTSPDAAMAILGHHGGLTDLDHLREVRDNPERNADTVARFYQHVPEARELVNTRALLPENWRNNRLLREMGVRMVFSALVDADHLDTAAHFQGSPKPALSAPPDMAELVRRFEDRRRAFLTDPDRRPSPIDEVRSELYDTVVRGAMGPGGIYRLPAPTGSGKTITSAGFALHHAAHHHKARVIVAVPFLTITEQNANVYRRLLGDETVLEHHSQVEFDGSNEEGRLRLAAENWDAPFVVTTTVQLFDSLFGRKPARSRKLHRLSNAVLVLDEVQALPVPLLIPILDALKLLSEHFGTTVLLTSATQPSFEALSVWSGSSPRELVNEPVRLFQRLRRARYEWWVEPKPEMADVADSVAQQAQALVVVNTVGHARRMFRLLSERSEVPVRHLSTRMCPAHRRAVLEEVRDLLKRDQPVLLVSTQLIEAGVDVDFPVVFRAVAPAESLQQAAGRANREGQRAEPGRVVVFDAIDAPVPVFYRTALGATLCHFGPGPGQSDPDDVTALDRYYRDLYHSLNTNEAKRGRTIQQRREKLDFLGVAEGPMCDAGRSAQRDPTLAFRMIDDDTVPIVVTGYQGSTTEVEALLTELRAAETPRRATFRALRPYLVTIPQRTVINPAFRAMCQPVVGDLWEWRGEYHPQLGIDDSAIGEETVW
jgi:CRISPR-associated endonuclease/helicase Cas3